MKRIDIPKSDLDVKEAQSNNEVQTYMSPPLREERRDRFPPDLLEIMVPSLKVGVAAGALGAFTGVAAGIIRSAPPVLFSLAMGSQWFTFGTSYYASRLLALSAFQKDEEVRPVEKVKASAVAGGFAGMVGGAIRGPRNIVPGMIFWSVTGGLGQLVANAVSWRPSSEPGRDFLQSKWSPVTYLSDPEYEKILEEKLLRVEAEIAIVDENIKALRDAEKKPEQQSTPRGSPKAQ